jgi:hypothetical protein
MHDCKSQKIIGEEIQHWDNQIIHSMQRFDFHFKANS